MRQPSMKRDVLGLFASAALGASTASHADLKDDSHLSLGLRNFYVDRDFKQSDAPKSRNSSWSQGFNLHFQSGYTDTPVQVGFDLRGQYAIRLDGGGGRAADGILPLETDGTPVHDYGRANGTLKLRYSRTELRVGEQTPNLPVASYDPSRQLVTTYQGALLESKEVEHLTLTAGRFWRIAGRDSSNYERIYLWGDNRRTQASDGLNFAGASYAFTPDLTGTYFYGELEDIYRQHYTGLAYRTRLANEYSLRADARYFDNKEAGRALSGRVDNRTYGAMVSVGKGSHQFGVGYQRMQGQDVFPTFNNYAPAPYLINWSALGFVKPGERSWQVRYDYDMAGFGVPGLRLMARYMKGTGINLGNQSSETERTLMATYVAPSGPWKGFGVQYMNIHVDTRNATKYDENRLALTYLVDIF
ncbi:OprD family outer membrane porin [Pseudomonas sp. Marseille-QA0892]